MHVDILINWLSYNGLNMQHQPEHLIKQQLKWQTLRPFNCVIICFFLLSLITGVCQSYFQLNTAPIFSISLFFPIGIILLCAANFYALKTKKDTISFYLTPITSALITVFISFNSYFHDQTTFLYLLLLLPFFYSYLLAYNRFYLLVSNGFLAFCYFFAASLEGVELIYILFNGTLITIISYLTIFTPFHYKEFDNEGESLTIPNKKNILIRKQGLYLNSVIHDIRQPLSSLSLYSHLLEKELIKSPHLTLAKNINQSSTELAHWITSLLDLARLDSNAIAPTITEFTLAPVLSAVIKKHQQKAAKLGIKFKVRLPELAVKSESRFIVYIMDTLIDNALVHGSQEKGACILLSARHYKNKIILQVWNQGKEIDRTTLENLFDELAQANNPLRNKSKGIGLSLAIAQRKAHLCGINIQATTSPKGSRFSLALEAAEQPKANISLHEIINQSNNYKILLIDDDQGILNALAMLLENWGYSVDCAETAEEGVSKFNSTEYGLVISDYRLPNQKTGLDVINNIKNATPAILLTGEVDPNKLKEVKEASQTINYKILNKPVKPALLRTMLKQLLKSN